MNLSKKIDHTLLKANCTESEIKNLCAEAVEHNFFSVCIPPSYTGLAISLLKNTSVKICTVVGFPLGYSTIEQKISEISSLNFSYIDEFDVVWNISKFKSKNIDYLCEELKKLSDFVHEKGKIIKIIIETAYLSESEIVEACELCSKFGVDFVKTSTGFAPHGATVENIELMRKSLPKNIKIKASGGIKDYAFANALIAAGADRIGSSNSVNIIKQ